MVAVKRERLHTHPGMLLKSPALWSVVKQFCEGRNSATGLKTPFNNLDEDLPQLAAEPKANLLVYAMIAQKLIILTRNIKVHRPYLLC